MFEQLFAGIVDAWGRRIFFQAALRAAFRLDAFREVFARVQVLEEAADRVNVLVWQFDSACLIF